jgi:hypothetical protein
MSTLASRPVADAVDVSFTDDELVVTLADARRVSAPLEWFPRLLRKKKEILMPDFDLSFNFIKDKRVLDNFIKVYFKL